MTQIYLYDTLNQERRAFTPANPDRVTMYVCGPTVYNRAHIGNARPAVIFDVLARLLRHTYGKESLTYARNVTDIDDKIIDAAQIERVDPAVISDRYERYYLQDMGSLGVEPPSMAPHATHSIAKMIEMIKCLVENGHAYEADGHVLFFVPSDPLYGQLSGRNRDEMIAGARVEVASYKKDPADFVLWKPSPDGVIGWESPWGRGRPGWHIECSAMIDKHLGETIDIHGGGLDLIFPHHENELAQSRCAHGGTVLARYWIHNGFLSMAGSEKMSKSLGNVVTVDALLREGHKGETLRAALLSVHYRKPLQWSEHLLMETRRQLDYFYNASRLLRPNAKGRISPEVLGALSDDLNTHLAIAHLKQHANAAFRYQSDAFEMYGNRAWEEGEKSRNLARRHASYLVGGARLLGLLRSTPENWFQGEFYFGSESISPDQVEAMIARRTKAKAERDYSLSDTIRDDLRSKGILLEDSPQGTTWRRA